MPEKFGYPDGLTAEDYYKRLEQDKQDEKNGKCNGQHESGEGEGDAPPCDGSCGNMDSHDGWGEGNVPQEVKDMARERLREIMKGAANEANAKGNGWGSMPADVRRDIMRFINGTIDWKAVLRMFVGSAQKSHKSSTVKRINKRFPYIHPGKKSNRTAKIAISIDQSGSVSDELLEAFFGELNSLSKLATFTVIPFVSSRRLSTIGRRVRSARRSASCTVERISTPLRNTSIRRAPSTGISFSPI
jgi:predicted metal-dependent peptidase